MSISRFPAMKSLSEDEYTSAPLSLNTVAMLTTSIVENPMTIASLQRNSESKYAATPDHGTAAITTATKAASVWNYQVKYQATLILQEAIKKQQRLISEMDTLIEHTQPRLEAARGSARNETSMLIFVKSLQKYESAKTHAVEAIRQLRALAMEVRFSPTPIDYRARMESILYPQLHRTSRCSPCDSDDASSVTSSFSKRSLALSSDCSYGALERMRHLEQVLTEAIDTIDAI